MLLQTKKTKTKNTPLNAVISEVSKDPFLFAPINTYDSKVYNNDDSTNNNKKKGSSRFGRKFDKLIIGSTSHACPCLFNLDLVWISWSYQRLFILPYQANFMWSSIG